MSQKIK